MGYEMVESLEFLKVPHSADSLAKQKVGMKVVWKVGKSAVG